MNADSPHADSPLDRVLDPHDQVRVFLDSAHSSVVIADDNGLITYLNHRAVETFGYQPDELIGSAVELLFPRTLPEDEAVERERYRAHPRRMDLPSDAGIHALAKDGRKIPVEVRLTPLRLADGTVWTVAGLTDLSARVAADERTRVIGRTYRALAEMNQAIVRAQSAQALYAETCRIAVDLGGYLGAWVGTVDQAGAVRPVARAGSLDAYIDALDIRLDPDDPRGRGPAARALLENQTCFSIDFAHDPETAPWHELAGQHGVVSVASLPLRVDGEPVAVLNLYLGNKSGFNDGISELYEQVADNLSFALDGFAVDRRMVKMAAQRKDLLMRVSTAEETERARIAAEIHDDSVQTLAAIELRLGLVRRKLVERDSTADLVGLLDPIQEGLAATTSGLRSLLFELEAPARTEGCATALRNAAEYVFDGHPIRWQIHCDDDADPDGGVTTQALRIVKEALINVRKHARASRVEVRAVSTLEGVEVTVTDDGVGFGPDADLDNLRSQPGHRGLDTMRDRAAVSGGWLRFERGTQSGTTLRFFVPRGPSD